MPDNVRRVMLFDLYSSGHHLQYLSQLAAFWVRNELRGQLDIVVPSHFVNAHPTFKAFVEQHREKAGIDLISIEEQVFVEDPRIFRLLRNDFEHGRLIKKYVAKLRPDHCVIMVFDDAQISLAKGLRFDFPVRLSGIYFRPSFHYNHFARDQPGLVDKMKRLRKQVVLAAALRNPHFTDLFCLDPYVLKHIRSRGTRTIFLPDGIEVNGIEIDGLKASGIAPGTFIVNRETTREQWGVEIGRKVALFFGGINGRKGLFKVLESVDHIPPEIQEKLCLVFAGAIREAERHEISSCFESFRKSTTVQLIVRDAFVDEKDVQGIIRCADLALITYQRHVGSSGVLIRAAAEQIPVLGPDYGLIGEHIRRHRLGYSVDTTSAQDIAGALEQFIRDPNSTGFDEETARAFVGENTAEHFSSTIFNRALYDNK